ncbi:MAG: GNAT family N-acetyltransferase [Acidimicrobiales bacterium]
MVVADPLAELLRLVTGPGDPPATVADPGSQRAAELLRRRFGLALPPPFASVPAKGEALPPVRRAVATDGGAIAAIKWRAFGVNYRSGVLDDAFLDTRGIVPDASFWAGRAMLAPTRQHRLLAWGRPGTVLGYADIGPVHPEDADPDDRDDPEVGEVYELYVDPLAQGRGGGGALLEAAERWFVDAEFATAELNTLATNAAGQAFYRSHGWEPTGQVRHVDLTSVAFDEVRFRRRLGPTPP